MPWQKTSAGSPRGKPRIKISPQIRKAAPHCRHSMNSPRIAGWCTATLDGRRLAAHRPIQTDIEEDICDVNVRSLHHRPWPGGNVDTAFSDFTWSRWYRLRPTGSG